MCRYNMTDSLKFHFRHCNFKLCQQLIEQSTMSVLIALFDDFRWGNITTSKQGSTSWPNSSSLNLLIGMSFLGYLLSKPWGILLYCNPISKRYNVDGFGQILYLDLSSWLISGYYRTDAFNEHPRFSFHDGCGAAEATGLGIFVLFSSILLCC